MFIFFLGLNKYLRNDNTGIEFYIDYIKNNEEKVVDLNYIKEEIELCKQIKKIHFNLNNNKITDEQIFWFKNNSSKIIKHLSAEILKYFFYIDSSVKGKHIELHDFAPFDENPILFDFEKALEFQNIKTLDIWFKNNKKTIINVFDKYSNEITKEKLNLFYKNYNKSRCCDKEVLELPLEIYLNYVDKETWCYNSASSVVNLYKKNLRFIINKKRISRIRCDDIGFGYIFKTGKYDFNDMFYCDIISNDLKDKEELYFRYLQYILFTSKYIYNFDFYESTKDYHSINSEKKYIDNNLLKETTKQSYAYLLEGIKNLVRDELLSKTHNEKYYYDKIEQHKKNYPDERYGGPDAVIDTAIENGILDKKFKKYFHYRDVIVDNLNEDIGYLFTKDCLFEITNIFNTLLKDKFDITIKTNINIFEKREFYFNDFLCYLDDFFTEVRTGILLRQHIRYLKDDLHFLSKNVSIPGYDKKSGGLLNQRINPICAHNSNSNKDLLKIQNEPYPITSDPRFETTLDFLDQNKLLDNSIVSFKNIRNNASSPEKQIAYLLLLQASVNKDVKGIEVLNMFNNGQKRIEYNTKLLEEKSRVEDILQNTNPSAIKNIFTKNK